MTPDAAGNWLRKLLRDAPALPLVRPLPGPIVQFGTVGKLEYNFANLPIADVPAAHAGLRIVHLSDLHIRHHWPRAFEEIIAKLQSDVPDLMLYTGDFVDDHRDHRRALPHVKRLVSSIPSKFGSFAVIGNHDGDLFAPRLKEWGVRLLAGEIVELNANGSPLEIIGLPGPMRWDCDERVIRAMPDKRAGVPRIVLSHYPDLLRFTMRLNADIFLAGHTHGGQVCLPGGIPIIKHDALPRRLCSGIHRVGETWLVVSRGAGFATYPIRVFCPAEVIEIKLQKSE